LDVGSESAKETVVVKNRSDSDSSPFRNDLVTAKSLLPIRHFPEASALAREGNPERLPWRLLSTQEGETNERPEARTESP